MKREILNEYLGSYVHITFFDGDETEGKLCFCPEFSEKYGFRKPGYYYTENWCFKASHVKKLQAVTIDASTLKNKE